MFVREARFSARLNHANIVQTSGIIETAKGPAIVMEYLEGHSLAAVLARARTAIPLAMHLRIIVETLRGLHYAHELTDLSGAPLNVVHRDISPQNVFVTYDGQVKLIDFGIAKLMGSVETVTGVVKGKMRYMPREQLDGAHVDWRADVYATGVMLWEAATRERMWKGETDVTIMRRVLSGEVPSPRATNPEVPEELERIILKALSPDREARHATAADLEADVEAFLGESTPVTSREIGRFVARLFEEVRAETKRLIAVQLSRRPSVAPPASDPADAAEKSGPRAGEPATSTDANKPVSFGPESGSRPPGQRTKLLVMGALALGLGALGWRVLDPIRAERRASVAAAIPRRPRRRRCRAPRRRSPFPRPPPNPRRSLLPRRPRSRPPRPLRPRGRPRAPRRRAGPAPWSTDRHPRPCPRRCPSRRRRGAIRRSPSTPTATSTSR